MTRHVRLWTRETGSKVRRKFRAPVSDKKVRSNEKIRGVLQVRAESGTPYAAAYLLRTENDAL